MDEAPGARVSRDFPNDASKRRIAPLADRAARAPLLRVLRVCLQGSISKLRRARHWGVSSLSI